MFEAFETRIVRVVLAGATTVGAAAVVLFLVAGQVVVSLGTFAPGAAPSPWALAAGAVLLVAGLVRLARRVSRHVGAGREMGR